MSKKGNKRQKIDILKNKNMVKINNKHVFLMLFFGNLKIGIFNLFNLEFYKKYV